MNLYDYGEFVAAKISAVQQMIEDVHCRVGSLEK